jgi:hypothetical protein
MSNHDSYSDSIWDFRKSPAPRSECGFSEAGIVQILVKMLSGEESGKSCSVANKKRVRSSRTSSAGQCCLNQVLATGFA